VNREFITARNDIPAVSLDIKTVFICVNGLEYQPAGCQVHCIINPTVADCHLMNNLIKLDFEGSNAIISIMQKTLQSAAIRHALTERGLAQKDLAKALNVSAQAVTNWLQGKDFPRPAKLLKLAATLHLTFDELVQVSAPDRPIVAFRKKGSAKTKLFHISKARDIGELLKLLLPYLAEQQVLRTQITSPCTDYRKLQLAVTQTRERLGIGARAVLDYHHLISEFKNCAAVLAPVMWGARQRHENALHIRLPKEDVTFIFLNLDTRIEDFKFWMAHELAHVYTPELAGTDKGEDFADAFAGALLFPKACTAAAYDHAHKQADAEGIISVFQEYAQEHQISLNTVYQQVKGYARNADLPALSVDEKSIHSVRNSCAGPLISEALFKPMPPAPARYIAYCGNLFQSDFFHALKRMYRDRGTGPAYLQQILDLSIHDARAVYEELRR
jgi:transcriptional regulator with XRE-family HTH domain